MFDSDDMFDVFSASTDKPKMHPKDRIPAKEATTPPEIFSNPQPVSILKKKKKIQKLNNESSESSKDTFGHYVKQKVVHKYTGKQCKLEVAYPPNWDFEKERKDKLKAEELKALRVQKPAKVYPFKLDDFQVQSIACVERFESVLVAAHTSAGKTVVAEYAIAKCLRDNQRVIYTSPIKALSNQKYRELAEEFEDVGLMTGDVVISPNASCLVMTTEILRNMLYRGSEVLREVGWIIFDEIHYMTNKTRGVVWEESIALLPPTIKMIFLSATVPNGAEFALWVAKLKEVPCNVISTEFRPTPLQHYIFPKGGDGLHLIIDENGIFREHNFLKAMNSLTSDPLEKHTKNKTRKDDGDDIFKVVKMILERHYDPVIIFNFSRKDCETNAMAMAKLDFCNVEEKVMISRIFTNALDSLSAHDRNLAQIQGVLPLLKRGIGMHHSGLLPILKEIIEILFGEGLIKALFATETFAMGLNMPAKTVVFTKVTKFDGEKIRNLTSGEYIQMAGRAGRRGKDDRGIVVVMMDPIKPLVAKQMMQGEANRLESSFYLGYNMLLNLILVESSNPEHLIVRSFYQFQRTNGIPKLKIQAKKIKKEQKKYKVKNMKRIQQYSHIKELVSTIKKEIQTTVIDPINIVPFLNPGRLIRVVDGDRNWKWGIVLNFQKKKIPTKVEQTMKHNTILSPQSYVMTEQYVVDCLLRCARPGKKNKTHKEPKPCREGQWEMMIVPILLHCIADVSQIRLHIEKNLKPVDKRNYVGSVILEVQRRFKENGIPLIDPVEDMKIKDASFLKLIRKEESLNDRLEKSPFHRDLKRDEKMKQYEEYTKMADEIEKLEMEIKNVAHDFELRQNLQRMSRVLRSLDMVDQNGVVAVKGRFASVLSACDELVATELLFSGLFNELGVSELLALCSCLIYRKKPAKPGKFVLAPKLVTVYEQLKEVVTRVAQTMLNCKIQIEVQTFVESFRNELMMVVYAWCQGTVFKNICKITNIYEGEVIRVMRRLFELLKEFETAAHMIGNEVLVIKFKEGQKLLQRDIIFAASLYL